MVAFCFYRKHWFLFFCLYWIWAPKYGFPKIGIMTWHWHNYACKFSPFYFFRLNWVGCFVCFIVTLALLESKASSTMMFHNTISLNLVVGTYMGAATSIYKWKNTLGAPFGHSFHRLLLWIGLWKVDSIDFFLGKF